MDKTAKAEADKKPAAENEGKKPAKDWGQVFQRTWDDVRHSWVPNLIVGLVLLFIGPSIGVLLNSNMAAICGLAAGIALLLLIATYYIAKNTQAPQSESSQPDSSLPGERATPQPPSTTMLADHPVAVQTPPDEAARRQSVLAALRNEYTQSHDNISPAIVAGTAPLPAEWINRRLAEMGEPWRVSDAKDS